jgi:Putative restriction endonuclease
MTITTASLEVAWEKLPDDFVLDDEPVDNILQPAIAAALTESLQLAGRLTATALTLTNYGICATVNRKIVVKAPDWGYIPAIWAAIDEVKRSYTPQLQGDSLSIVMEFLSDSEGGEYSIKPTYPPGKWFFYEQVLKVPYYAIFDPATGLLELYRLEEGRYKIQDPDNNQRYWIENLSLFLGVWQGDRSNIPGYWLRWWDQSGNLLLWGTELVTQEQQARAQAEQQASQEHQRAERLAAQLRAAGIDPDREI